MDISGEFAGINTAEGDLAVRVAVGLSRLERDSDNFLADRSLSKQIIRHSWHCTPIRAERAYDWVSCIRKRAEARELTGCQVRWPDTKVASLVS